QAELRPAPCDFFSPQLFALDSRSCQHLARASQICVFFIAQPEHTGSMKDLAANARLQFAPLRQRAHRPARVEFVRSVAHAYDTGLSTGTRAAVARPVGV